MRPCEFSSSLKIGIIGHFILVPVNRCEHILLRMHMDVLAGVQCHQSPVHAASPRKQNQSPVNFSLMMLQTLGWSS